ncbi:hypothetical protein QMZ05_13920 [Bradyrhizobium sp. INPA03-11B]|uniref:hypothetical protein n=1 Tax=Bradyrhizobium sp. INPA03-11B TaxID=418598 RepID=UPI00338D569B
MDPGGSASFPPELAEETHSETFARRWMQADSREPRHFASRHGGLYLSRRDTACFDHVIRKIRNKTRRDTQLTFIMLSKEKGEAVVVANHEARSSDLVEIARRSGEFRKHYGVALGAFLYLSSISAARPRSIWWSGVLTALIGAVALWIKSRGSGG